jgi:hypothetical protein
VRIRSKGSVAPEMKEWQLHQTMFCRGSLENGVRLQRTMAGEGTWEGIGQLGRVFWPETRECHHLDHK